MNTLAPAPMLRIRSVAEAHGIGLSTVWWYVKIGLLPPPVKIGERSVAWPSDELAAIIAARRSGQKNEHVKQLVTKLVAQRSAVAPNAA